MVAKSIRRRPRIKVFETSTMRSRTRGMRNFMPIAAMACGMTSRPD
jgi:hypothetical protein